MGKELDKKAQWRALVEEEKTTIYSLAYWLTKDSEVACELARQAIVRAGLPSERVSKIVFLGAVADNMCHLFLNNQGASLGPRIKSNSQELVLRTLMGQEQETRLLLLFYCLLDFDREALREKLEWPREKLNSKLNEALGKIQSSFLAQGLITPS